MQWTALDEYIEIYIKDETNKQYKINIVYSFVRKSHKLLANWSKASI